MSKSLYEVLGFEHKQANLTGAMIKASYRKLVTTCHPDKFPDDEEKAELFREIQEAYDILKNNEKRREYDKSGKTVFMSPQQLQTQAEKGLVTMFNMIFDKIEIEDIESNDIVSLVTKNIDINITQQNEQTKLIEKDIRKIDRMLNRMRYNGEEKDYVRLAMENRKEQANKMLTTIPDRIKVLELMSVLIEDYDYDTLRDDFYTHMTNSTSMNRSFTLHLKR